MRSGASRRRRRSTTGSTKASVFPLPVQASTATSLLPQNSGMVASCKAEARVVRRTGRVQAEGTPGLRGRCMHIPCLFHLDGSGLHEARCPQNRQSLRAEGWHQIDEAHGAADGRKGEQ